MNETRRTVLTGGCQCGAVRYALYAEPTGASICHCRMCQKAFGNYFAPLTGVKLDEIAWTRGAPATFRSSEAVERGFCRDCGTPLTYRILGRNRISVSIGSLDQPDRVHPERQHGIESVLPDFTRLSALPAETTDAWVSPDLKGRLASRQHPDRDTPKGWAPPEREGRST
ncbi:MAG TPA: GFA family protein [Hyphomicrobiaceae bacterium]|nr:GFA family protein [Hyphomicrobiaceae bacterium]